MKAREGGEVGEGEEEITSSNELERNRCSSASIIAT